MGKRIIHWIVSPEGIALEFTDPRSGKLVRNAVGWRGEGRAEEGFLQVARKVLRVWAEEAHGIEVGNPETLKVPRGTDYGRKP